MEVLGAVASGLTLVGLLKVCVEAFDVIQTARHQELDCRRLILRLNIEKCRLYTWGQAMGLTDAAQREDAIRPLQDFMFEELVREALQMILLLFGDATKLRDMYGCKEGTAAGRLLLDPEADLVDKLAAAFKRFRIKGKMPHQASELYQKAKWSIYDKKKFATFVTEAKSLVDGLQDITKSLSSLPQQKEMMTHAVGCIQDVRTNILIADVCEEDYPELSEVSARATENASVLPDYVQRIDEWKLEIDGSPYTGDLSQELESMTTTELKHKILQLIQRESQSTYSPHTLPEAALPPAQYVMTRLTGSSDLSRPHTISQGITREDVKDMLAQNSHLKPTMRMAAGITSPEINELRPSHDKEEPRSSTAPASYGGGFKCEFEGCQVITKTLSDYRKHLAQRLKVEHVCHLGDCSKRRHGFATINDLNHHTYEIHRMHAMHRIPALSLRMYRCFAPGCKKHDGGWPWKGHFQSHLRMAHPNEDVEDLVRQAEEAWDRLDEAKGRVVEEENSQRFAADRVRSWAPNDRDLDCLSQMV